MSVDTKIKSITDMLNNKVLAINVKNLIDNNDIIEFSKFENRVVIKVRDCNKDVKQLELDFGNINTEVKPANKRKTKKE